MTSLTLATLFAFNPSAALVGIAAMVLMAIVGVMVGPNLDGMNAPAKK